MEKRRIVFVLAALALVLEVDSATYCKVGEYFHPRKQFCSKCKVCVEGEAMIRACGTFHNAKCEECPNGTFSQNNTCKNCTICSKNQKETKPCNISSDAICTIVNQDHSPSSSISTLLITVITLSILVVLVIVVVVLIVWRRRHRSENEADEEVPMASSDQKET